MCFLIYVQFLKQADIGNKFREKKKKRIHHRDMIGMPENELVKERIFSKILILEYVKLQNQIKIRTNRKKGDI